MTTREEFEALVDRAVLNHDVEERIGAAEKVLAAWDAQAAEVERLRAEVEALRTGVPLTAENAPRARVVETSTGMVVAYFNNAWGFGTQIVDMDALIRCGATVLAWRRT